MSWRSRDAFCTTQWREGDKSVIIRILVFKLKSQPSYYRYVLLLSASLSRASASLFPANPTCCVAAAIINLAGRRLTLLGDQLASPDPAGHCVGAAVGARVRPGGRSRNGPASTIKTHELEASFAAPCRSASCADISVCWRILTRDVCSPHKSSFSGARLCQR